MLGKKLTGQPAKRLSKKELAGKLEVARQFRKAPRANLASVPAVFNRPDAVTNYKGQRTLIERPVSDDELAHWHKTMTLAEQEGESVVSWSIRFFSYGELNVVLTRQFGRLHLSVSHPKRLPTWDECSEIWYNHIRKSHETAILVLPKPENFVNIHRFTLQIFGVESSELPDILDE